MSYAQAKPLSVSVSVSVGRVCVFVRRTKAKGGVMFIPVWTLVLMALGIAVLAVVSFYVGFGFMACLVLSGRCNRAERDSG